MDCDRVCGVVVCIGRQVDETEKIIRCQLALINRGSEFFTTHYFVSVIFRMVRGFSVSYPLADVR
jgi:hypothetical protein